METRQVQAGNDPTRSETRRTLMAGLVVLAVALATFALVTYHVVNPSALTQMDTTLSERFNGHAHQHPWLATLFLVLTETASTRFLTVLGLVVAAVLLWRQRPGLALAWVVVISSGAAVNYGIKNIFLRERPSFPPELRLVTETTASFTSGHSAGATVCYGMLAYLLLRRLQRRWARIVTVTALGLLILAIGFSRIYLGAHWFSDVIGGFAVGTAWLAIAVTPLEIVRCQQGASAEGR